MKNVKKKRRKIDWSRYGYFSEEEVKSLDRLHIGRKSYNRYLKMYDKKSTHLSNRYNHTMFERKMTYEQWKQTYATYYMDAKKEMVAGVRKNLGDINQYLVSRAAYDVSEKQARNIKAASLKLKTDIEQQLAQQEQLAAIAANAAEQEIADAAVADLKNQLANLNKNNLSLTEIRLGKFDFKQLSEYYHELREGEQGLDSYESRKLISWYFFGSE